MKSISVILATVRPDKARECIEKMKYASPGIDYEVVVVSPIEATYKNVTFVKEEKKQGMYKAVELGIKHATGKYIFVMADDQLLETDCLKDMLKLAEQHNNKIFLTGARTNTLWEMQHEQAIYGTPYPCNSFIRKDCLEQIGGLYDTHYDSYLGDPDLALRVVYKGGKVQICETAWIESCNVVDDVETTNKEKYLKEDYDKFMDRWQSIYAPVGTPRDSSLINRGIRLFSGGYPMEICARIIQALKREDYNEINEIFRNRLKYISCNNKHITNCFVYFIMINNTIPALVTKHNLKMKSLLVKWFLEKFNTSPINLMDIDYRELRNKGGALTSILMRNFFIAVLILHILKKQKRKFPYSVIEGYKHCDITYNGQTFLWRNKKYDSFIKPLMELDSHKHDTPQIDYLELRLVELYLEHILEKEPSKLHESIYACIDYFCSEPIKERRLNLFGGYLW